ncbi:unnamed protein product [Leuciscus chuanchicus]
MADFTMDEVRSVVEKARAGSASEPSGTMYKIYKNCPLLLKSSVNLYSKTSKLCLPVSSVAEEYKATKARAVSTLLLSKDGKVQHASKSIRCGRKWKPQEAVSEAEAHWKHQEIVGVVCQGRLGLGHYNTKRWSKANTKGKRELAVQRVREAEEEHRRVKAVGLASQGQ